MSELMTVSGYMTVHEVQLCDLCDDLDRVSSQEEPLLNALAATFRVTTGISEAGVKTYPRSLIALHFMG